MNHTCIITGSEACSLKIKTQQAVFVRASLLKVVPSGANSPVLESTSDTILDQRERTGYVHNLIYPG